ncbi:MULTISPECIES: hypothetical protein [unclassified Streptomyces]|uniref:hypothetical protein n=1 Tax=unclassified Streptomyces TaxID=2593676 RepID=UPI00278BDF5B|nr:MULTISPECIES: hypothetical protein [unclassified Streptomyces]
MPDPEPPVESWQREKANTRHALQVLASQMDEHTRGQDLFVAYTYAKKVAARALQARMFMHLPERNEDFHRIHARVQAELDARYGNFFPDGFLKTPYSGQLHERLFSLLQENLNTDLEGDMLRIVTADSVHTERRARELRELGLDVECRKAKEGDFYNLHSLDLTFERLPSLVRTITRSKVKEKSERDRLLERAGIQSA